MQFLQYGLKGEEKRDLNLVSLSHVMYNTNGKPNRIIIVYNFLGEITQSLSSEIIDRSIQYTGLNELLNTITEEASNNHLTVDEAVELIYDVFEDYIDQFEEENEDIHYQIVFPHMEEVIVADIKDYDSNGDLAYDVYTEDNGPYVSPITKMNLSHAIGQIEQSITNTNLIVIVIDMFIYGQPIGQYVI